MKEIYQFPTAAFGNGTGVLSDTPASADTYLATTGAAVAASSVLPAPQSQATHTKIEVIQVTFSVNLVATLASILTNPYATFGKLFAACYSTPTNAPPDLLNLDAALLTTLWNGDTDAAPALWSPNTNPIPLNLLTATITPPEPIELFLVSEFFGVGLWLTPSAVNNVGLLVSSATASITYDEVGS